ncbi:AraC family transcriptional regulator [Chitinophaga sp. Cy-1792]|uniref:helix-turn-helix domain-containing protein n=1 Tax=Chitinophaga sp. Cy-1792 TaxID=2608339 RepID=UPI00141D7479|nr:helix-turn-helix domain-containing protein [Chitinophaga sp. Cy-1792]NIG55902.1 AraC family transcriptional regulator [Chitinophaga sp. Cy-1792]
MKDLSRVELRSISEYHSFYGLDKPMHPLVSVINYADFKQPSALHPHSLRYGIYSINLKKNFDGKVKYGQQYYDFDEGVMTFYAPSQVINIEDVGMKRPDGFTLIIHPDFLHGTNLMTKIHDYGFFSYAANEALLLSEREEQLVEGIFLNLQNEIGANTDVHTHDVVLSHIDLLLSYSNRFYNRQFITRKSANNTLVAKLEAVLHNYFTSGEVVKSGLPTVQYLAAQLNVSASYLGDMLRYHTGMNTQQHIQQVIIERAKELLTATNQSVAEIAYQIGFEHPQSFNKLFKSKTSLSPLQYRQTFN